MSIKHRATIPNIRRCRRKVEQALSASLNQFEAAAALPWRRWELRQSREQRAVQIAHKRATTIFWLDEILRDGRSQAEAARILGVPYVTLWRWRKAWRERGFDGLIRKFSTGRPPKRGSLSPVSLTDAAAPGDPQGGQSINSRDGG
jgi:hypothetical protein